MPADLTGVNWDDCALEKITEMVSRRVFLDREGGATFVQTDLRRRSLRTRWLIMSGALPGN